jgi:NitT/TauT family transport system substrate-binding protein
MKTRIPFKMGTSAIVAILVIVACTSQTSTTPEVIVETVEVVTTVEVPVEVIVTQEPEVMVETVEVVTTVEVPVEVLVTPEPEVLPELTALPISLGFRATVLYAPLYVADAMGFFADEGLELDWQYGSADDIMVLLATNERPIISTSGGDVLLARGQGLPVMYFYQWHNRDNYAIFSLAEKGIVEPADLVGKSIGVPFLAGGNYLGLQATLWAEGISETDMTVQAIGFTQIASVAEGVVDAAVGVVYNEPNILTAAGHELNVIETNDYQPLVSSGFAVNEEFMRDNPDIVQGFANAFTNGLAYTIENPWEAFKISLDYVPETNAEGELTRLGQLQSGIQCCDGGRLGFSDPAVWQTMSQFLLDTGWLAEELDVSQVFTNEFVGDTVVWPPTE